MINQQVLAGNWDEVKGKLKEKWGKLTDDDVRVFNGNVDQLIGRIQQKTGESREAIEHYLDKMADEGSKILSGVRERVEQAASQAGDTMREGYDSLRDGYSEAERMVQDRPGQSIAVAFGLGVLAGLGAAILLRDRSQHARISQARSTTEQLGRHLMDAMHSMIPESMKSR